MHNILIIGAGRSSGSMINYLLNCAPKYNFHIMIADVSLDLAQSKINGGDFASAFQLDLFDASALENLVEKAGVVISMVPANFHIHIAKACLKKGKSLLTASYINPEIKALEKELAPGQFILMECGLDPGLDHMTAIKDIRHIQAKGGKIVGFKSFTGGLIAPESDNNPWNYKFTWNPRNVVLAGQGTAKFIRNGEYKYIPYHQLFKRIDLIEIPGYGTFEGYANRDSLSYREVYGLQGIPTLLRGTLRKTGFCAAWDVFVQLGMTDDSYQIQGLEKMTYRDFLALFLPYKEHLSLQDTLKQYLHLDAGSEIVDKMAWLGIFEDIPLDIKEGSPALVLQTILERKWVLDKNDKDMIVMQHQFEYELDGHIHQHHSSMVCIGEDQVNTAMAKTVGLPLAIAVKNILLGRMHPKGVCIPITEDIYAPILEEIAGYGVKFL